MAPAEEAESAREGLLLGDGAAPRLAHARIAPSPEAAAAAAAADEAAACGAARRRLLRRVAGGLLCTLALAAVVRLRDAQAHQPSNARAPTAGDAQSAVNLMAEEMNAPSLINPQSPGRPEMQDNSFGGGVAGPHEDVAKEDAVDGKGVDYQVIFEGRINIRKEPDPEAEIIGTKWKCNVFRAAPKDGWVKLWDEPGYIAQAVPGAELIKPIPVYYKQSAGGCTDIGAYPIHDQHTCKLAATAMGLADTDPKHVSAIHSPEGCYLKEGKTLWLAENSEMTMDSAMPSKEIICSSYQEPSQDCHPITTTITTTSTEHFHFPSLFCWSVVRAKGYEAPLVRKQLAKDASIFACDEFTVLSNGGKVWLAGDWFTVDIPMPVVKMGNLKDKGVTTNSWLNTGIFIKAWELIRDDGRFKTHDWTVKADPDAVVFPWRIRALVKPHTPKFPSRTPPVPPSTDMLFFLNCNRSPPTPKGKPQLYGAVEVFSRRAMLAYYFSSVKSVENCKKELKWHGWGEDSFMQHCMLLIGASAIYEFGWVADDRCIPGECWDEKHAAFHDFKDEKKWFKCWNEGLQSQSRP